MSARRLYQVGDVLPRGPVVLAVRVAPDGQPYQVACADCGALRWYSTDARMRCRACMRSYPPGQRVCHTCGRREADGAPMRRRARECVACSRAATRNGRCWICGAALRRRIDHVCPTLVGQVSDEPEQETTE